MTTETREKVKSCECCGRDIRQNRCPHCGYNNGRRKCEFATPEHEQAWNENPHKRVGQPN